jgi:uncharacterized protein YcsI (UPF0317 family)
MALDLSGKSPKQVRAAIASGEYSDQTSGLCTDYAQANLVILPKDWAFDFLLFTLRNPKPCPLIEVLDPGDPYTKVMADRADVRSDIPRYRVWENGEVVEEPTDIKKWWKDDLVSFFLGCSFGFEDALLRAGVPVRHQEIGVTVPMYETAMPNQKAGRLGGNLVVSMRPIPPELVERADKVTGELSGAHGAPVHKGDPAKIGIKDLNQPDFSGPVPVNQGEVPVFWACGVTPQSALMHAKPPFAITHMPGSMFIGDIKTEDVTLLNPSK